MLRDIYRYIYFYLGHPTALQDSRAIDSNRFQVSKSPAKSPNDFSVRQSVPGTRCIFAPRFFPPLRYCLETVKHYQVLFNISNIICSLSLCLSKGLCYFSIIDMQNFGNYRIKDVHHPAENANPLMTKYMVWLQSKIQPSWLLDRNRLLDIIVLVASFQLLSPVTQAIQYIQSISSVCVIHGRLGVFLCSSVEFITLESDYLVSVVISRLAGRGNHPFHLFIHVSAINILHVCMLQIPNTSPT